ncbi:L-2-hydroxyglutarate oxidase [Microlunatus lacustris]
METRFDVIMIGAGIVGLAAARELHDRYPHLKMAVLDKEEAPGQHQSGHNSGVLHAGVYYKPGSLKARLCVDGKQRMERFADEHGIAYETCGKLIVALHPDELSRLDDLYERGVANGVPGLRKVGKSELREIEPHAAGVEAIHSPGTGIIDFGSVVTTLARLLVEDGVELLLGHEVTGLQRLDGYTTVQTNQGDLLTRRVISCGGLHSDRLAAMEGPDDVAIIPFRGDYYTLKPEARSLCRGLIYPVPDPTLPFLGVHFTKRYDGEVWAGPNAVLATEREGYTRTGFNARDLWETVSYPGFRKMAQRFWRVGAAEVWRDAVKAAFVKDLQRYVPEVRADQLVFGPSGVRAQAVGRDGTLVDDFTIVKSAGSMHVVNAPSPAATAALAIASMLADEASSHFELGEPAGNAGVFPGAASGGTR